MSGETYSAHHEYLATALAREMNGYFAHVSRMDEYFKQRDIRGKPPVYREPDRAETEEYRLKIVVLCAMYVEALANLYLSLKLKAEQFAAIDRTEIVEKWVSIPSLFLPGYSIPRDKALYEDLKILINQRNAVAHMKPRILAGAKILHEGSTPKKIKIHSQIKRWDQLPTSLVANLKEYDQSVEFANFKALSYVAAYRKIRLEANQAREDPTTKPPC